MEELNRVIKKDSQHNDVVLSRSESKSYVEKPYNETIPIIFHTPVSSRDRTENQVSNSK